MRGFSVTLGACWEQPSEDDNRKNAVGKWGFCSDLLHWVMNGRSDQTLCVCIWCFYLLRAPRTARVNGQALLTSGDSLRCADVGICDDHRDRSVTQNRFPHGGSDPGRYYCWPHYKKKWTSWAVQLCSASTHWWRGLSNAGLINLKWHTVELWALYRWL